MFRHYSRTFVAFAMLLLACGCGSEGPPPYDRLHLTLLQDLFRALQTEDYPLAIRKLDRLDAVMEGSPAIADLQRVQVDNIAIAQANERVAAGDYRGARDGLRDTLIDHGRSARLNAALELAEKLLIVDTYTRGGPPAGARETAIAVAELPEPGPWAGSAEAQEAYALWHAQQARMAAGKLRQEKLKLIDQTRVSLDRALLMGGDEVAELLDTLTTLQPGGLVAVTLAGTLSQSAWAERLAASDQPPAIGIASYLVHTRDLAYRLPAPLPERATASLTGRYVQTAQLLEDGQILAGMAALQALTTDAPSADLSPLLRLIPQGPAKPQSLSPFSLIEAARTLQK